jgi:hypothetical protein
MKLRKLTVSSRWYGRQRRRLKICERLNAVCCRCQVQASLVHSSNGAGKG